MASKNEVAQALAESERPRIDPVAAALTAYEPSWRERIGNSVYDAARYLGMDSIANRLRNDVETGIDFVPFVGDAIGLDDARNDFNAGNYGMAAAGLGLSAAGIVPGVGDAVAAGGRKILSAGAENARVVADMLASGRANEVTNDMISAADPSELWKLYESGATGVPMPMDQASRMARAREMGFDVDTPLYHGTTADIDSFVPSLRGKIGPGVYMTPDSRKAGIFSGYNYGPTPGIERMLNQDNPASSQVYQLYATNRPATMEARQAARQEASAYDDRLEGYRDSFDKDGFDGVSVDDERTILDPSNIRSQFARFDPRLRHLSHLSAGLAGAVAAGTISLEMANQMQELGQDYQP